MKCRKELIIADLAECEEFISQGKGSREYIRLNFDRRLIDWTSAAELGIWQGQWLLVRCYGAVILSESQKRTTSFFVQRPIKSLSGSSVLR